MATINSMDDLFVETLKDIYYAEKQIAKTLPGMARKAHSEELKQAFEKHVQATEDQIERIEKIFTMLDLTPRGRKCEAIEGIIREAKGQSREIGNANVLDADMIGFAQAVEHYEICRYGTLTEWAKSLGLNEAAELLSKSLTEEKDEDVLLTKIARSSANPRAAA